MKRVWSDDTFESLTFGSVLLGFGRFLCQSLTSFCDTGCTSSIRPNGIPELVQKDTRAVGIVGHVLQRSHRAPPRARPQRPGRPRTLNAQMTKITALNLNILAVTVLLMHKRLIEAYDALLQEQVHDVPQSDTARRAIACAFTARAVRAARRARFAQRSRVVHVSRAQQMTRPLPSSSKPSIRSSCGASTQTVP